LLLSPEGEKVCAFPIMQGLPCPSFIKLSLSAEKMMDLDIFCTFAPQNFTVLIYFIFKIYEVLH
jgi:hypothetical protein